MITIKCDICGKETKYNEYFTIVSQMSGNTDLLFKVSEHCCYECFEKFKKFIKDSKEIK